MRESLPKISLPVACEAWRKLRLKVSEEMCAYLSDLHFLWCCSLLVSRKTFPLRSPSSRYSSSRK